MYMTARNLRNRTKDERNLKSNLYHLSNFTGIQHIRQNSITSSQYRPLSHAASTSSVDTADTLVSNTSGATLTNLSDNGDLNPDQLCDLGRFIFFKKPKQSLM